MGRKFIVILVAIMLCLSGCANAEGATVEEEKDYRVHYTSEVSEEECCICGENDRSMMGYYRKSGMIGLVCLNAMSISSLDVSPYSNDGAVGGLQRTVLRSKTDAMRSERTNLL